MPTTPFGNADLAGMISPFGVPCSIGVTSFTALKDVAGQTQLGNGDTGVEGIEDVEVWVTAQASALPACTIGDTVTVDGTAYIIRSKEPVDDGALMRLGVASL